MRLAGLCKNMMRAGDSGQGISLVLQNAPHHREPFRTWHGLSIACISSTDKPSRDQSRCSERPKSTFPFTNATPSFSSIFSFLGKPCAKPVSEPFDPTTRWHGTCGANGLRCSAPPTARTPFVFSLRAMSAYVTTLPRGMRAVMVQTFCENVMPGESLPDFIWLGSMEQL
jgi:hypothetical protein